MDLLQTLLKHCRYCCQINRKTSCYTESRIGLFKAEGKRGMLVTNETGTGKTYTITLATPRSCTVTNATGKGKTYTGLGVIKRF